MRQGRPVREPEDVELALRAIAQLDYVRAAMRPLELVSMPVLVVLVIVAIATGLTFIAIAGGVGLAGSATLQVLAWQRRRQLQRSAQATRRFTDI